MSEGPVNIRTWGDLTKKAVELRGFQAYTPAKSQIDDRFLWVFKIYWAGMVLQNLIWVNPIM